MGVLGIRNCVAARCTRESPFRSLPGAVEARGLIFELRAPKDTSRAPLHRALLIVWRAGVGRLGLWAASAKAGDIWAGKTIISGLLIQELELRSLAERILIVLYVDLTLAEKAMSLFSRLFRKKARSQVQPRPQFHPSRPDLVVGYRASCRVYDFSQRTFLPLVIVVYSDRSEEPLLIGGEKEVEPSERVARGKAKEWASKQFPLAEYQGTRPTIRVPIKG
jgi:hypothetical protein